MTRVRRRTGPRRSRRDRAVDLALFVLAALFGLFTAAVRRDSPSVTEPEWLVALDQVTGALGCASLWLRRRWPTQLAVALVLVSAYSETVSGAMVVALFTVAIHGRPSRTWAIFGLSLVTASVFVTLRPDPDGSSALLVWMLGLAVQSAAVGWGLSVRHRRQLIASLREQALRAGREAELRAEQAQQQARDDIAREIHDVLGHRLSLLTVHAGALEYRPDLPPEQVARTAGIIRDNAHQALQDLRDVVGVLRAPVGDPSVPALPQPRAADLPQLVAESREAGMSVALTEDVTAAVPEPLGRTVHRIVQEALTNARRHAPGSPVQVSITGAPGTGLELSVRNEPGAARRVPVGASPAQQGRGLLGLRERVALAEGRLRYGPDPDGGWRVAVWLPWPP